MARWLPWLLLLGLLSVSVTGCNHAKKATGDEPAAQAESAQPASALPPLEVTDDTKGLLLTWIDDKGDFHVTEKPADVPEEHRQKVRVAILNHEPGTGSTVYVADLTKKQGDGHYAVSTMSREQWDHLGADLRKARLEALAPKAGDEAPSTLKPASEVSAVIYGADWCKPCHQAEAFLKKLGVKVTKKDIDKNPAAASEMRAKVQKLGRPAASIPVIDVMGQVVVGFSESVLRNLVDHARGKKP